MHEVSLLRLYLLRATYALFAVGQTLVGVPRLLEPLELMEGVVNVMLVVFGLLSYLGLHQPLRMLPLMLWELFWKTLWLASVAWPLWRAGTLQGSHANVASLCLLGAFIPFVVPWRYVWRHYVVAPAERWR